MTSQYSKIDCQYKGIVNWLEHRTRDERRIPIQSTLKTQQWHGIEAQKKV